MESADTFVLANQRAKEMQASTPRALSARYDPKSGRIVIQLSSDLEVRFSPRIAQGLEHATPAQLRRIEISPSGFGLHFPKLDADLYLPPLLEGSFGSKKWMAARLGHLGGRSRSPAKRAASQKNGALGGRPRKRNRPRRATPHPSS
jgi:Protein of unknown function (DUF2442)